jgi:Lamin Tail Domain/Secretion system C-terminal sorting domain
MFKIQCWPWARIVLFFIILSSTQTNAQVIISQYYEGGGTNKWIELTNLGSAAVNTSSPQLKLGLWSISGSTGSINITGAPSQTLNLSVTIPAGGSVLIGHPTNGTEVSYLTAASAVQTSSLVINFNGNDGIALLDASNNIIDQFGQGINAADISYVRSTSVTTPSATYVGSQWTAATLATVNAALFGNSTRLGYHLSVACAYPVEQPTGLVFNSSTSSAISASFTAAANTDEFLVVQSTNPAFADEPVDGDVYNIGQVIGDGIVVGRSNATNFSSTGLSSSTTYYYFIFSVNSNCIGGPVYLTTAPLTGNQATSTNVCATPAAQPISLTFGNTTTTSIAGSFITSGADEYLVVMSTVNTLSSSPSNATVYNAGNSLGGGTVISRSVSNTFTATGLNFFTNYYFFIFSVSSNCTGGPIYLSGNPLTGSKTTNDISSGTLNFYFGNLHSHSSHSDGNADDITKIPADDYAFAKTALCMDFLGISDHNHVAAGMQLANWQPGRTQAAAATTADFVGLYGMEWGVISGGGHAIVYGMDSLMGWDAGQYQVYVPKNVYTATGGLFNMLNRHGANAFAYLAHPNMGDYDNLDGTGFDISADEAIVGTAVASGPAFSTNTTYSNPPFSMSYLWYYNLLLSKGYHLGPTIDHDNHNMTFGKTAKSRLAILAPGLSENDLLDGMRRMRFYASEDCNARINFSIHSQPMGTIFTYPGAPMITVSCATTAPIASLKLMTGVPGSGNIATELTSTTGSTLNYSDNALANLSQQYYYLDITETDGTRIITSPIWYSRNDAVLVASPTVTSFFAVNEKERVVLKWTTGQEENQSSFIIERSVDFGRTFTRVGSIPGKGFNNQPFNTYALTDLQPFNGAAYYRLIERRANGEQNISDIKIVDRGTKAETYFTLYPNPVHGILTIRLVAAAPEKTMVELFDMAGRRVGAQPVQIKKGEQQIAFNMSKAAPGTYVIKINSAGKILSQLVNKF